jgi:hypothetical protein
MKCRDIYRWLTLPPLFLTVVGLLFVSSACGPAQPMSISPTSQTVAPEQTFTVDILVDRASFIAGAQFDLSFDPSLVTAISVDEGNLLSAGGCATLFLPGTIDNVAGTITGVVGVIIEPEWRVSGTGTLATVRFSAGTTVGTSPLALSNVEIGNKEGQAVDKQIDDGTIEVSAE